MSSKNDRKKRYVYDEIYFHDGLLINNDPREIESNASPAKKAKRRLGGLCLRHITIIERKQKQEERTLEGKTRGKERYSEKPVIITKNLIFLRKFRSWRWAVVRPSAATAAADIDNYTLRLFLDFFCCRCVFVVADVACCGEKIKWNERAGVWNEKNKRTGE